jgi:hypothetical protein
MSVIDVSKALRHVHNQLDVEKQWLRATSGLAPMTHLQRAQVWADLSSHTLSMDAQKAPVVLSQYKALYKAALKTVDAQLHVHSGDGEGVCDGAVWEMLEEYKDALELFKMEAVTMQHEIGEGGERVVRVVSGGGGSAEGLKKVVEKVMWEHTRNLTKTIEDLIHGFLLKQDKIEIGIEKILPTLESFNKGNLEVSSDVLTKYYASTLELQGKMNKLQDIVISSTSKQVEDFKKFDDYIKSTMGAFQNVTQFDSKLGGLLTDMAAIKTKMVDLDSLLEKINPEKISAKWARIETGAMEKIQHSIDNAASAAATAKESARQAAVSAQRAANKAGGP